MPEIPESIGPYRILAKIGEGGMGGVYKAEDQRLRRVVALKVIREFDSDSTRRQRFCRCSPAPGQRPPARSRRCLRRRQRRHPPRPPRRCLLGALLCGLSLYSSAIRTRMVGGAHAASPPVFPCVDPSL